MIFSKTFINDNNSYNFTSVFNLSGTVRDFVPIFLGHYADPEREGPWRPHLSDEQVAGWGLDPAWDRAAPAMGAPGPCCVWFALCPGAVRVSQAGSDFLRVGGTECTSRYASLRQRVRTSRDRTQPLWTPSHQLFFKKNKFF